MRRDASYFQKIETDTLADNEDVSGESDGVTENGNTDTDALQKEKQQETKTLRKPRDHDEQPRCLII